MKKIKLIFFVLSFLNATSIFAQTKVYFSNVIEPQNMTKVPREEIVINRVYTVFSQILGYEIQTVAMKENVFNIHSNPKMHREYPNATAYMNAQDKFEAKLQWWEIGINTVLPGNFFGLGENRRFILKGKLLHNLDSIDIDTYWEELETYEFSTNPIIVRAFHTPCVGTRNPITLGNTGNGLFAWSYIKGEDGEQYWCPLTYRYHLPLNKWIINDLPVVNHMVLSTPDQAFLVSESDVFRLEIGAVLPEFLINPDTNSKNPYSLQVNNDVMTFIKVSKPSQNIGSHHQTPFPKEANDSETYQEIIQRLFGREVPEDVITPPSQTPRKTRQLYNYYQPYYAPNRYVGPQEILENQSRYGTPYNPTNPGERKAWEKLHRRPHRR